MSKTAVQKRPITLPVWGGCDVLWGGLGPPSLVTSLPILGKTVQTSHILATNKIIKNHKCRNLLSISLTHWTTNPITKCALNVHCDESWDKQRRQRHWLMAATIEWSSFHHSTNSLLFQFCKTSQLRVQYLSHRLSRKFNCSCVVREGTQE